MSALEERAEALAGELPGEARIIGLLLPAASGAREARAVDGLATALAGRRRRTLLANLAPGAPLDRQLGAEGEPGAPEVLAGEASLEAAALRPADRPFLYLRAGTSEFEPGRLLEAGPFGRLARRLRGLEGTLLVVVPEADVAEADLSGLLDGVVLVGGGPREEPEAGVPVLGALGTAGGPAPEAAVPAPDPGAGASAPDSGAGARAPEGRWERHSGESGFPTAKVVATAALLLGIFAGWWFLVRQVGPASRPGPGEVSGTELPAGASSEARSGSGGAAEEGAGAERLASLVRGAAELPYSVLIASYSSGSDARERVVENAGEGVLYFVSPTPVRGRLYHRLFAGARSERGSADSLMRALARAGRKDRVSDWDVRPVPYAFRLAVYADREEARREVERLAERRIPAYVIPVARGERRGWQLYAGAYETEEAAAPMRRTLEAAGEEARLVRRRGVER